MCRWICLTAVVGACLGLPGAMAQSLELGGEWGFRRDAADEGVAAGWMNASFEGKMALPGAVPGPPAGSDHGGQVEVVWLAREVEIPGWWQGQRVVLRLERCPGESRLWIDGRELGQRFAFTTAHVYDVTESMPAGRHRVVVRVDPRRIRGLLASNVAGAGETWRRGLCGLGPFVLQTTPKVWIEDVQLQPDRERAALRVAVTLGNRLSGRGEGGLTLRVEPVPTKKSQRVPEQRLDVAIGFGMSHHLVDFPVGGGVQRWDPAKPTQHRLIVTLNGTVLDRGVDHEVSVLFGLREVRRHGSEISLNGQPISLPDTVECAVDPRTGSVSMDAEFWRGLWRKHRKGGRAAARFSSWCLPEVAFATADEVGVLITPDFGDAALPRTPERDEFVRHELAAMAQQLGHHPSYGAPLETGVGAVESGKEAP